MIHVKHFFILVGGFHKWLVKLKNLILDSFGNQLPVNSHCLFSHHQQWHAWQLETKHCHTQSSSLNFPPVEDSVLPPRPFHLSRTNVRLRQLNAHPLFSRLSFRSSHAINPPTPPSHRNTLSPLPISSSSLSLLKIDAYLSPYPLSHMQIKKKPVRFPFSSQTPSSPCSVIQTTGRDLRPVRNRFSPYPSSPLSIITPTTNLIPLYT
jgi:hypothetical protein